MSNVSFNGLYIYAIDFDGTLYSGPNFPDVLQNDEYWNLQLVEAIKTLQQFPQFKFIVKLIPIALCVGSNNAATSIFSFS